ncbi:MAG: hypothetical protein R3Y29_01230 [bacterium]
MENLTDLTWTRNDKINKSFSNFDCLIWGENSNLRLICSKNASQQDLEDCQANSLEMVRRINTGKEQIIDFIMDTEDNIFELAQEWLVPLEKTFRNGAYYYKNEQGALIPRKLTKQEFRKYIFINSVEIRETSIELIADIIIKTVPDCFSDHFVELFIIRDFNSNRYQMSLNGIVC